jgi:hypothetical protein
MPEPDRSPVEYPNITSLRSIDEPAARVGEFAERILAWGKEVTSLPVGPTTIAGITPYEEVNPRTLPSTGADSRLNFRAGNYLVVPQILNTEPLSVLYYTAYLLSAEKTEWLIGPDSVDEFVRNAETYEWLALLLAYAKTADNRELRERLTAVQDAAKEGKTILERLQEMYRARRGHTPTRAGSTVSLLADLVLNAAGAGLVIAGQRERKQRERAMVRLIEGAKRLGIEPFVVHHGEQLNIGSDGNQYHTVRFRTVFIDVDDVEARVEARKNVIGYCKQRLEEIDDIPPTRIIRKRFKWIRDTLEIEVGLLEADAPEMVPPGGDVNIYWLLNIDSTAKEMTQRE